MSFLRRQPSAKTAHLAVFEKEHRGFGRVKMALFLQGPVGLLFILIFPMFYFERTAMLAAAQYLEPVFWSTLVGSILAGFIFNILRWEDLNNYFDRNGTAYFGEGFEDDTFNRFIQVPIACGLFFFSVFVISIGALSTIHQSETTRTFDVVWKGSVSKQCRGYKTLPTSQYMKMHICRYPAEFAQTVNMRGRVTIKGFETPVGFRGVEIISFENL